MSAQDTTTVEAQYPDHVEIRVEDLSVVPVEPGDVILVRHPRSLTMATLRAVRTHVERHFPGHEVVVLDDGMQLALLRPPRIRVVCGETMDCPFGGQWRCVLDEGHDAGSPTRVHRTANGAKFTLRTDAGIHADIERMTAATPAEDVETAAGSPAPGEKRTPAQWERTYGLLVIDPDGWRGKGNPPWTEPITLADFWRRYSHSTARELPQGEAYDRLIADVRAARAHESGGGDA